MLRAEGEAHMHNTHHDEGYEAHGVDTIVEARNAFWQDVVRNPEKWHRQTNNTYVAGGEAVIYALADKGWIIWPKLEEVAAANNGTVVVAGVPFTLQELDLLGRYYSLDPKNKLCIDERLVDGDEHAHRGIHDSCGLIAALEATTGLSDLEDTLALRHGLDPSEKHPLHPGTEGHHISTTIHVSFSQDHHIVHPHHKSHLHAQHALAFHASIPIDSITEFDGSAAEREMLLHAMVKWNPKIAGNIIGGAHNAHSHAAHETLIVMDQRGVGDTRMMDLAHEMLLSHVQHGHRMYLVD